MEYNPDDEPRPYRCWCCRCSEGGLVSAFIQLNIVTLIGLIYLVFTHHGPLPDGTVLLS